MSEEYKKAIDILASEDTDFRSICVEFAKDSPSTFVFFYRRATGLDRKEEEIRDMAEENFMYAIKETRRLYNMTLKDAKAFVEELLAKGEQP